MRLRVWRVRANQSLFFGYLQREAVVESLKNMLLVMSTQGMFQPRQEDQGQDQAGNLWDVTWTFLEPFLPNLKEELFPPVPAEEVVKAVQEPVAVVPEAGEPAEVVGGGDSGAVDGESSDAKNEAPQAVEAEA